MNKIRKSFTAGRTREVVLSRMQTKPATPKETQSPRITRTPSPEPFDMDAYLKSPETIAYLKELKKKHRKAAARRAAKQAERKKQSEERRRNPQSPIDAYWNYIEKCPFDSFTQPKERKEWKRENSTFEFNGVTYNNHWFSQRSNSGKTSELYGCLKGSDGSLIWIREPPAKNRRNDPERNWGLGPE
jgi:hypothetical protein